MERETNQPVSSQCPVALSTLGWHLLGLRKLPQPLRDVTARYALPCLPGPGALAGIMSMKETGNVFIETQAAKSAKQNKVLLSGGDRDPGPLGWTSFCKSQSSVLKYTQPQSTACVSCRCQDGTGETGPKDEYLGNFNGSTACAVPSLCGLSSPSPPQHGGGPVLGQLLIASELTMGQQCRHGWQHQLLSPAHPWLWAEGQGSGQGLRAGLPSLGCLAAFSAEWVIPTGTLSGAKWLPALLEAGPVKQKLWRGEEEGVCVYILPHSRQRIQSDT